MGFRPGRGGVPIGGSAVGSPTKPLVAASEGVVSGVAVASDGPKPTARAIAWPGVTLPGPGINVCPGVVGPPIISAALIVPTPGYNDCPGVDLPNTSSSVGHSHVPDGDGNDDSPG